MRAFVATVVVASAVVVGCGGGGSSAPTPTGSAATGLELAKNSGCSSCHGAGFVGGTGPSWIKLFGSEVELSDGTIVTADREYLFEAIRNPSAQLVDGFPPLMPANSLDDEAINAIVDYIEFRANG